MAKNWIQTAIERPGRVKKYVKRVYGSKAFDSKGRIKTKYLNLALKRAEKNGNDSLASAIRLAKKLKRLGKKKKRTRRKRSVSRRKKRRCH